MKIVSSVAFSCIFFFINHPTFSQQNAGDIQPGAVQVDFDSANNFSGGLACISKGKKFAYINSEGGITIPYGQFQDGIFNDEGLAMLSTSTPYYPKYCFIDTLIHTYFTTDDTIQKNAVLSHTCIFFTNGKYENLKNERTYYYYPKEYAAKKILFINGVQHMPDFEDGLALFEVPATKTKNINLAGKDKYGYIDSFGNVAIKPVYDSAENFSENLAAVAFQNEFGEVKWAYVNRQGKTVLPYLYTIRPGLFENNRAVVVPKPVDGNLVFDYIDHAGAVKFSINMKDKFTRFPGNKYNYAFWYINEYSFNNGYAHLPYVNTKNNTSLTDVFVDSTGKTYDFNLPKTVVYFGKEYHLRDYKIITVQNKQVLFKAYLFSGKELRNHVETYGIAGVSGNIIIPPVFTKLSVFNTNQSLAYAEYNNPDDTNSIKGFVNKQGVFTIIQSAKAKF